MLITKKLSLNIKENFKDFFIEEVLKGCENLRDGIKLKPCVLILDSKTTKILDSFIDMIDLLEAGIIGIENIYKKRKWFE